MTLHQTTDLAASEAAFISRMQHATDAVQDHFFTMLAKLMDCYGDAAPFGAVLVLLKRDTMDVQVTGINVDPLEMEVLLRVAVDTVVKQTTVPSGAEVH